MKNYGFVFTFLIAIICISAGIYMAINNIYGWGWFLVIGIINGIVGSADAKDALGSKQN